MFSSLSFKRLSQLSLVSVVLYGCAVLAERQLNEQWGEPQVQNRVVYEDVVGVPEYHRDIQPIFNQRCVVCHACYDAACQLKLSSFEGVDRGATKAPVYDGTRLLAAQPSRLLVDAKDTLEWRQRGYFPVLNERAQTPEANLEGSLLFQTLKLKQMHPLPDQKILEGFDFSTSREDQCPTIEEFPNFQEDFPLWGMPYGMPALAHSEFVTIQSWLANGAKVKPKAKLDNAYLQEVEKWESFFNGHSLKAKLFSRYAYEHLYLGHLYFESLGPTQYFRLVRSRTPPGQAIDEIATRRPFDDPGSETFYYRLRADRSVVVDKTHMPYLLSDNRMSKWADWFFKPDYQVTSLPSYDPESASNPFETFKDLPVSARYRFMLEEAEYTIMGYIKGPVCRGQVALNVIEDHFWVFFVDPDVETMLYSPRYSDKKVKNLRLPAAEQSNASPFDIWTKYSKLQSSHIQDKLDFLEQRYPGGAELTLNAIWDGDGVNQNAALTIFRHFDNATVIKGLHGKKPKTAWVLTYSLLERIHYLLVAGFDVYGNIGHQLNTRLYMDFLRMEGESQFLMFLPEEQAEKEFLSWYVGAESKVEDYIGLLRRANLKRNKLVYQTDNVKQELFDKLEQHLGDTVLPKPSLLNVAPKSSSTSLLSHLNALANVKGKSLQFLPELSFIRLTLKDGREQVLSLALNRFHQNVSSLLMEEDRWVPSLYYVSLHPGILGSYPNTFYHLEEADLPAFTKLLSSMKSEEDYRLLLDRWGVRRSSKDFWQYVDWLHDWYRQYQPLQSGIIDLNRFENR
ncbi:MAG: fatty acid cis/trans isomerase [Oleiphilus sp.]